MIQMVMFRILGIILYVVKDKTISKSYIILNDKIVYSLLFKNNNYNKYKAIYSLNKYGNYKDNLRYYFICG